MGIPEICKKVKSLNSIIMKFLYSEWESFCKSLFINGIKSVTAASILRNAQDGVHASERFINIKHDVESSPSKALALARIEHKYGHCATYYVQAYLMTESNQPIFSEIQKMGHEVTYHHDVMDGGKGDLQRAIEIYKANLLNFRKLGFEVNTVCQHGNPASDFENRDFFRSGIVQSLFPEQADIMVDFMKKIDRVYTYISDVGMSFKIVKDPVNSDKIKESERKLLISNLKGGSL